MADITIIMPSYNRGKYIGEALDSIFMQETTYDYHIIITDDCSTDNTIDIARQYQEKYPGKITLLTSEKNQKLYKNILKAYEQTKTDYFCVLDPDDYWTDKYKIQKALDFLKRNKDFTIYVTSTAILQPDGRLECRHPRKKINSSFSNYLKGKAVLGNTLGSVFKNVVFKNGIPEKMRNLEVPSQEKTFRGDSFRNAIHICKGMAHYVPEVDAVYRVTDDGLWQGSSGPSRDLLNALFYKDIWIFFDKAYPELLVQSYKRYKIFLYNFTKNFNSSIKINELEEILRQKESLEKIFEENEAFLNKNIMKYQSIKVKLGFIVYKFLVEKLAKIGLL